MSGTNNFTTETLSYTLDKIARCVIMCMCILLCEVVNYIDTCPCA